MEANILPCVYSKPPPFLIPNKPSTTLIFQRAAPQRHQPLRAAPINTSSSSGDDGNIPPTVPPPDTVEIRFRRGSRKRSKQQLQDGSGEGSPKPPPPPKEWESMTMKEKAVELYMGEKGLLFWLNKLAYASIFIIIGAWILFRFVGPSLGLYQLDSPTKT